MISFIQVFLMPKMIRGEVTIYHHPNPEIRSFLTTEEISAPRVDIFKSPLTEDADQILNRLGRIGAHIVKEIMTIPGVDEIHIKPKEVRLKKALTFAWDDIEEQVLVIMRRALRRKRIRIIRQSSSDG